NHCGGSSFENQWRASAPLVSDCQTLANNIRGDGDWTQSTVSGQRQIASFGSCHFGVEGADGVTLASYRVGNEDVMDIIHDSITKFQRDGRVAAKGVMPCDNIATGSVSVLWGIY
ncbi:Ecp2 effector protein, partial [Panaeolus papilionaceus]